MKTFCPFFRPAISINACQAVKPTSGTEAASVIVRCFGFAARSCSWMAMNSAKVPMRPLSGRA